MALSTWNPRPGSGRLIFISVQSPSDTQHILKDFRMDYNYLSNTDEEEFFLIGEMGADH